MSQCTLCGGAHPRSKCPWDKHKEKPLKTIISGHVSEDDLSDAELLAGITPTEFLTNGHSTPPASSLRTTADPPCPMLPGELGWRQRNYTLCNSADALITDGSDPHLTEVARKAGLVVYEVA